MTTRAQAAANGQNAQKSTGPRSGAGKNRSRLNGLVHGLRSEEVVIPGEDPAEFEAERAAWFDEFQPKSRARASLVERAVVAAWRCRRCVRIEAQRLDDLGRRQVQALKVDAAKRVAEAEALLNRNPALALTRLLSEREGVVRLMERWSGLALAAASVTTWADAEDKAPMLCLLLGYRGHDMVQSIGPAAVASWRLTESVHPRDEFNPFGPLDDREGALATIQDCIKTRLDELTARLAQFDDPEEIDLQTALAGSVDASNEGKLLHRYEMAHDRSLRASITALIQLDKSGLDVPETGDEPGAGPEAPSEPIGHKPLEDTILELDQAPSAGPRPVAAGPDLRSWADCDESAWSRPGFREGLLDLLRR